VLLAAFFVKSRVVGQGGMWVGVRKF